MNVNGFDWIDAEDLKSPHLSSASRVHVEPRSPVLPHPDPSGAAKGDGLPVVENPSAEPLKEAEAIYGPLKPTPVKLVEVDSVVKLLKGIPGFECRNSVYRFHTPITQVDQQALYDYAKTIYRITLSDNAGTFAPSVFLRISLLPHPERHFLPSLSELVIKDGNSYLEFLSLFIAPGLRTLEFSGINEAAKASFVEFCSSAAGELLGLTSLRLLNNALCQTSIQALSTFASIRVLHLEGTVSVFDYHLLEALGRMETLIDLTFIQSNNTVQYRSRAIVQADEAKRLLEEKRAAEEEERKRKELKVAEEKERRMAQEREKERHKVAEARRVLQELGSHGTLLAEQLKDPISTGDMSTTSASSSSLAPVSPSVLPNPDSGTPTPVTSTLPERREAVSSSKKSRKKKKAQSIFTDWAETLGAGSTSGASPKSTAPTFFNNLISLNIIGIPPLIQDLTNLCGSHNLETVHITFVASEQHLDRCSDMVSETITSISGWAQSLRSAAINAGSLSTTLVLTFAADAFSKLIAGPHLRQLKIIRCNINGLEKGFESLTRTSDPSSQSMLEVLDLPSHANAPGVPLASLGTIAQAFPKLTSLSCRIKDLRLDAVPTQPHFAPLSPSFRVENRQCRRLSVGNAEADPKSDRHLDVARYIDRVFPCLETLVAHEGPGQNAEQWVLIAKVVKMLQEVRTEALAMRK